MKQICIIVIFLLFVTAGCTKNAITVDDEKISKEVFEITLKEKLETHKSMNSKMDVEKLKKAVSDELIAEALLIKEAKEKKISVTDEEVQKAIDVMRGGTDEQEFIEGLKKKEIPYNIFKDRVRRSIIISKLMDSLVTAESVSDDEMMDYYKKRHVSYLVPEKEFVKILQVGNETEAKKVLEELKKSSDFDTVANSMRDSGRASVSDYGWINPDTFPSEEIASAMKMAKINVFNGPHKGRDGSYYFFKIQERQKSRVLSYEEARPIISKTLLRQKRREFASRIVDTGRKTARIKINM